jgi:hypothetical protein
MVIYELTSRQREHIQEADNFVEMSPYQVLVKDQLFIRARKIQGFFLRVCACRQDG